MTSSETTDMPNHRADDPADEGPIPLLNLPPTQKPDPEPVEGVPFGPADTEDY